MRYLPLLFSLLLSCATVHPNEYHCTLSTDGEIWASMLVYGSSVENATILAEKFRDSLESPILISKTKVECEK